MPAEEAKITITESLLEVFNLSLRTGIFPDDWKFAKVTPIYKSEDKTLCENYRPISVISNIAKIFEKLVCRQLNTFLDNNNIIVKNQSGFRRNHSTETSLLQSTEMWLKSMDQGQINAVIFLGPVYMIPARRDGMLTEIPLVIQILKSVYMIPPLIPPRRDLGNRCRDPA